MGPRAWSFWVLMPISAPKPNSSPSTKRVEALTRTAAASTSAVKRSADGEVGRDDGLAVTRAVPGDVGDGVVERVDHLHGQLEVEELVRPVVLPGHAGAGQQPAGRVVGDQLDAVERTGEVGQERLGDRRVDEDRLRGVAHRRALRLGVDDDGAGHVEVG